MKGGYLAPKPVALGEGILGFKNHSVVELITAGLRASMSLPTAGYGTDNSDINLEN